MRKAGARFCRLVALALLEGARGRPFLREGRPGAGSMATADECRERLERAGFRLGETAPAPGDPIGWTVSGWRGGGGWAWGSSREAARQSVCRQAEAPGLLPPE
jgi:hypothetical protein